MTWKTSSIKQAVKQLMCDGDFHEKKAIKEWVLELTRQGKYRTSACKISLLSMQI